MEHTMPHKVIIDVTAVWLLTGVANLLGFITNIFDYLPLIQHILAITSLILAIAYTAYKFRVEWRGWNPKTRKQVDKE